MSGIIEDIIVALKKNLNFFTNEFNESYLYYKNDSSERPIKISSKQCERLILNVCFENTNLALSHDSLKQIVSILDVFANNSGEVKKLDRRVSKFNDSFYYDLGEIKQRAIKIDKYKCTIDNNPPIIFDKGNNTGSQILPDLDIAPNQLLYLIKKHFRFVNEEECLLYAIYLITCLIPDIPHPILVHYGEKGAAKSTSMRMIKSLIDPSSVDLVTFPNGKADLALLLSNNYMIAFDNLDSLTNEKSDLLCMASTGGAFTKRSLYTNDEMTVYTLKRCITLNGIGDIVRKSDLLDRSIIIELSRIKAAERKVEKIIWSEFNEDKPKILGACFNALSNAMGIIDNINVGELQRMADFTQWGFAIAESLCIGGKKFLECYKQNQLKSNDETIASNSLASSIIFLMKDKTTWEGSVSMLLAELENIAIRERFDLNSKEFPRAAQVLSKRLTEIKSNLEDLGITFGIRHAGAYKKITLSNSNAVIKLPLKKIKTDMKTEGCVNSNNFEI